MIRLELERRKRGLTQKQLGRKVLYSRHAISKLERERPEPQQVGIRLKAAIEGFFGLSLSELFSEVE